MRQEFSGDNNVRRKLTTLARSVTHGNLRAFSVREPSHFCGVTLTGRVSVFTLFLFVSAFHSRYRARSDRRPGQIPPSTVLGVGDCG